MKSARASRRTTARRPRARPAAAATATGRLVTLRPNGQITLPAELRERVGARTGDVFVADVSDDAVVLHPKRLIDASQAYFWTPEWQKMEREASADIAAGRVKRAKDIEELIAELKD